MLKVAKPPRGFKALGHVGPGAGVERIHVPVCLAGHGKRQTIWVPQVVEGCQAPVGPHSTPSTQSISVQGVGSHPQTHPTQKTGRSQGI